MPILKIKNNGVWEELGGGDADTLDGLHAADLENEVYAAEESVDTSAEVINADTLGGILAKDYATKDDLNALDYEDVGAAPAGDYATESFVTNKIAEAQLGSGDGDTPTIDLSGYATKDDLKAIDFPVDSVNGKTGVVQLTAEDVGAPTIEYAKKVGAPYNLIRNSDLLNPVNLRGQTSYTGDYGIECWRTWNSDMMIDWNINGGGGVECRGTMYQYFDRGTLTGTYTLAAKTANGNLLVYCSTMDNYTMSSNGMGMGDDGNEIVISLPSNTYIWAALYKGEYTAETLPEYQPKGYAVELAACGGYVNKNGDTMTGNLTAPAYNLRSNNSWFGIDFHSTNGEYRAGITCDTQTKNRLFFRQKNPDLSDQEYFAFTPPTTSGTWYNILTSKDTVTVEQGGTNATNADEARVNLGLADFKTWIFYQDTTNALTALKNVWSQLNWGSFAIKLNAGGGIHYMFGGKHSEEYGAVIDTHYGGSMYRYRLAGGIWYEQQISGT